MNIEEIIRAWKAEETDQNIVAIANPVGEELTDMDLLQIIGGLSCTESAGSDGTSHSSCAC